MIRKFLLPALLTGMLAGCASSYYYRDAGYGGGYYYGEPSVDYNYYGGYYGWYGYGYGWPYYSYGWYGHPYYGFPYRHWYTPYPYYHYPYYDWHDSGRHPNVPNGDPRGHKLTIEEIQARRAAAIAGQGGGIKPMRIPTPGLGEPQPMAKPRLESRTSTRPLAPRVERTQPRTPSVTPSAPRPMPKPRVGGSGVER